MPTNNRLCSLHIVAGLHPSQGGPSRTVIQLTDALAGHGIDIGLVTHAVYGDPVAQSFDPCVGRELLQTSLRGSKALGWLFRKHIYSAIKKYRPNILHDHGLWLPSNHWAACASRSFSIPLIVQPRGMLEPWALESKFLKKLLAMQLYQKRNLETAKAFIATSDLEYENLRRFGLKQPIAVIPNGIAPFSGPWKSSPRQIEKRTVLFLSRLHPKKGLSNLIKAWALVRPKGWELVIAGPDDSNHLAAILLEARKLGVEESIKYVGEVDGGMKKELYINSDLFVLPTYSENFGVVVAEALSYGLPVITTYGAPWADLEKYECGWWIDVGVDPLVSALSEAMSLEKEVLIGMGQRGIEYVKRYNWNDISSKTISLYEWVAGLIDKPDFIRS